VVAGDRGSLAGVVVAGGAGGGGGGEGDGEELEIRALVLGEEKMKKGNEM